jgi:hypothetical protein
VVAGGARGLARPLEEVCLPARVGGDREGQLEETECLFVRAELDGPIGSGRERDARLGGERVALRSLRRILVGGEVVAGQASGELIGAQALEEARGRQVAGLAIRPGQRVVGDLPDEGLDKGVLATLGRAGVSLQGEELATDEGAEPGFELALRDSGDGREPGEGERLAQDCGVGDEKAILGGEPVEAARDEVGERLGNGEAGEVPDRTIGAVLEGEAALAPPCEVSSLAQRGPGWTPRFARWSPHMRQVAAAPSSPRHPRVCGLVVLARPEGSGRARTTSLIGGVESPSTLSGPHGAQKQASGTRASGRGERI